MIIRPPSTRQRKLYNILQRDFLISLQTGFVLTLQTGELLAYKVRIA